MFLIWKELSPNENKPKSSPKPKTIFTMLIFLSIGLGCSPDKILNKNYNKKKYNKKEYQVLKEAKNLCFLLYHKTAIKQSTLLMERENHPL